MADEAVKNMRSFARLFPIGQPSAWRYQGLYHWVNGKSTQAHKAWRKSLEQAESLSMPYDLAFAQFEIGRHMTGQSNPATDADRQAHLEEARSIFAELNAASDLARTNAALAVSSNS